MSPIVITGNDMRVRTAGRRVDRRRPGGAAAAAQHVGADHEILFGVERFAGADHVVPPAGLPAVVADAGGVSVAGEGVQDQDCVGFASFNSPYVS